MALILSHDVTGGALLERSLIGFLLLNLLLLRYFIRIFISHSLLLIPRMTLLHLILDLEVDHFDLGMRLLYAIAVHLRFHQLLRFSSLIEYLAVAQLDVV